MTVATRIAGPRKTASPPHAQAGQRFVLFNVSWPDYVAIGDALRDRPALRLTYDRGTLEFTTTSPEHEKYKKRLGRLVEVLLEEFGLAAETAGNMTFQHPDLNQALEADDCFWIAHAAAVADRTEWEPDRDPPPDLILEVEVSRSALGRLAMYATLGVPEVWRFDGESLRVHLLQPDGTYQETDSSPTFPGIPLAELVPFLHPREGRDYMSLAREFRAWVKRQTKKHGGKPSRKRPGKGK